MKKINVLGMVFVFLLFVPSVFAAVEDVVITGFWLDKNVMCAGEPNYIYLTLENEGRVREDVLLHIENTALGLQYIDEVRLGLGDNKRKSVFFSFHAPDEMLFGGHIISADIAGGTHEYVPLHVVDCSDKSSTIVFENVIEDSPPTFFFEEYELISLVVMINLLVVLMFVVLVLYLKKSIKNN
jgi:hypothetical protein